MEIGGIAGGVAGALLGVSELASLGVASALIGGRPQETIYGAIGGFLGGLAVGIAGGGAPVVLLANVGLLVGAIVGATLSAQVRVLSLAAVLLERSLRSELGQPAMALKRDGLVDV